MKLCGLILALGLGACSGAVAAPPTDAPPEAQGLEYIADGMLQDSAGAPPVDLGIGDQAVIGVFRHRNDMVIVTTDGVFTTRNSTLERVATFDTPMVHFQFAGGRERSLFLVSGPIRSAPDLLFAYEEGIELIAALPDHGKLIGMVDQALAVEQRGRVSLVDRTAELTDTGVTAADAVAFTNSNRILANIDDRAAIIDMESGEIVELTGLPAVAMVSQGIALAGGSAIIANLVAASGLDEQHQRPAMGLWRIDPAGASTRIIDLGNDDILGGFDHEQSSIVVHAFESDIGEDVVAIDLGDGSVLPLSLDADAVPLGWSLPLVFAYSRN